MTRTFLLSFDPASTVVRNVGEAQELVPTRWLPPRTGGPVTNIRNTSCFSACWS